MPLVCFYCWEPQPFHRVVALLSTHLTENILDRWKLKPKFDIQYSVSVVHYVGNVFYLCGCWETSITYWWKCFHKSFRENVVVFKSKRTMDSTHFLFRQGKVCPFGYAYKPYLYKCGVLGVICFLLGFYHNLLGDKWNRLHTFFFTNRQSSGAELKVVPFIICYHSS